MIDGTTQLYGLVREDPRASWSPVMHRACFEAQGLNAVYVPLSVAIPRRLVALAGAQAMSFLGLNVGAPHKLGPVAACIELDVVARATGAVNTLCRRPDGWAGHNTDALACRELLQRSELPRTALVLGAGGAARASVWALRELGIHALVAARRPAEATKLCDGFGAGTEPVRWTEVPRLATSVDCIVNAVPCDVEHTDEICRELRADQLVVDWVYGGTSLTRVARAAGMRLVVGDALLVRQGELANTLWTNLPVPEGVMARAIACAASP